MRRLAKAIMTLLILAAAFPAAAGEGHHGLKPFTVQPPKGGAVAKDFTLKDLDGRERSLNEFRGRTVLLHFWASWCEPCREEFPALSRLAAGLGQRGFVVLAVAGDSKERVKGFLKDSPAGFPVLIDQYGSVMRSYGISVIPASVLVGGDGRIEGVLAGPREYDSPAAFEFFEKALK